MFDDKKLKKIIIQYRRDMKKYISEISNDSSLIIPSQPLVLEVQLSGLSFSDRLILKLCRPPLIP